MEHQTRGVSAYEMLMFLAMLAALLEGSIG